MSRSGYNDEGDNWETICYRGAVASALRGKRGQAFLKELITALDALPEKCLVAHELEKDGSYCALGAVGKERGLHLGEVDPENIERVARLFGIADAMAREIVWMNDEAAFSKKTPETPEARWGRMRAWAISNLREKEK